MRENRICQREELISSCRTLLACCQNQPSIDKSCPIRPNGHSFPKRGNSYVGPGQRIPRCQYESQTTREALLGEKVIMKGMYFGIVFTNEVAV